jgi:acetyl-CoA carboxylase carboxyltransferase component
MQAAEKASSFLAMCDRYDIPIVSLCDTPGFMVGQQNEEVLMITLVIY